MTYAFIDLNARLSLLIVVFNLIKYMQYSRHVYIFTFSCLYIFKGWEKGEHHHHHHHPDNLENRNLCAILMNI